MKHKIEYSEFIERYLEDAMSSEERIWFEKEITGNHILQEEINFHRKVNSVLSDKETIELKAQLNQIHYEIIESAANSNKFIKQIYKKTYLAVGTIAAIVLFLTMYLFSYSFSNDKLTDIYYQAAETPNSYRGDIKSNDMLSEAMSLYKKQEYAEAINLFENVISADDSKLGVNLYSGISHMEIEEYAVANNKFQTIINQNPNPFVESATWYLGLCYLFTNEREKAKNAFLLLLEDDSYYKKDAKRLLRRL